MERLNVYYNGGYSDCPEHSEVYAIDSVRDRFLIVSESDGYFKWVPTEDCKPEGYKSLDDYISIGRNF